MLHLPAPGMSHRDRAVLAMALAYRYKSDPKSAMLDTALRLSDGKGRSFARRLGACLRLAYNLSGGAPGLLPQIQLRRTERELAADRPRRRQEHAWATSRRGGWKAPPKPSTSSR